MERDHEKRCTIAGTADLRCVSGIRTRVLMLSILALTDFGCRVPVDAVARTPTTTEKLIGMLTTLVGASVPAVFQYRLQPVGRDHV